MNIATVTTADLGLLNAVRATLAGADDACLCVAFAHERGIRLLQRELEGLQQHGARVRLLVTMAFDRDGATGAALALARKLGLDIKVHNHSGGTYHPKLYVSRRGDDAKAVIGSANLTGGLACNVEIGVALQGKVHDAALGKAWEYAEELWADDKSELWLTGVAERTIEQVEPALLGHLRHLEGKTIRTLSNGHPNVICAVDESGVLIETGRSRSRKTGPQRVEPWMLNVAWEFLTSRGVLANQTLESDLRVMRSAAVCAMLAHVPDVIVESTRPILLRWVGAGRSPS